MSPDYEACGGRWATVHAQRTEPRRMIVAPSSTATRQSWLVPIERRSRPRSPASSRQAREIRPGGLGVLGEGRHRHQPGDPHGAALDELVELGRGRRRPSPPRPRGSPRPGPRSRPAMCFPSCSSTESEATEWIRRTSGRIRFTLRLCRLPMKSQVKLSRQRSCFASRSWRRFSPTSVDPGLGQGAHVVGAHVLGGGEDLDLRAGVLANPLEVGADRCRVEVGDRFDHGYSIQTKPAWRPVRSPSRRWE